MKKYLLSYFSILLIGVFSNITIADGDEEWGDIDPTTLKDPHNRDETISNSKVTVKWEILADGKYAYTYAVQSLAENKGKILSFSIDISCDNPSTEPTGYTPLENLSDDGKHIQLSSNEPVTHPLLAAGVTADNQVSWFLGLEPGKTKILQRIITKEAPVLRAYELYPSFGTMDWYYKPEYIDDPSIPKVEDFIVNGTILGPRCTTDTSPIPENPDTTPEPEPTPANCPKGNAYGLDIGKGHEISKGKHNGHSHDCP